MFIRKSFFIHVGSARACYIHVFASSSHVLDGIVCLQNQTAQPVWDAEMTAGAMHMHKAHMQ